MMPEDVRKAICYGDECWNDGGDPDEQEMWQTIRAHLLAREAEVERLVEDRDSQQRAAIASLARAERAEALLRDIDRNGVLSRRVREGITAHLSENSR